MVKIKVDWEIDPNEDGTIPTLEELGLPEIVELSKDTEIESVTDLLSDKYDYLVQSWEVVE